jgi:acetyltransferase-like isoleucine patch superfamily enzyme
MENIQAEELIIGKGTFISPSATIRGLNGKAKRIVIGDNTYIGDSVQIIVDELEMGDYCKVHHHTNFHGYKPLKIGHNAWIGQGTIIDSIGGTTIGNNFGVGAYSQLWSHARWGDPLAGCNYSEITRPLVIGNDVWLVGHCIVSPVTINDGAMALVGSVITKDMETNHIYGGAPAKDLTDKLSPQFRHISLEEKKEMLNQFELPNGIKWIEDDSEIVDESISYFNISNRTYTKKGTDLEVTFMKKLQSKLIKFVPHEV